MKKYLNNLLKIIKDFDKSSFGKKTDKKEFLTLLKEYIDRDTVFESEIQSLSSRIFNSLKNINEDCLFFWGGIYSQWYKSEIKDMLMYPEVSYFNCAEQYMMYSKAITFNDKETADKILRVSNPRKQKALGREIKNFDPVIWDKKKMGIVVRANYLKFIQHEDLYEQMMKDKDFYLVEASPLDEIWGIGLDALTSMVIPKDKWPGQNLLGKAIMEAREILIRRDYIINIPKNNVV